MQRTNPGLSPDAQVAQLVEHVTENHGVGGSIPSLGTILCIPQRLAVHLYCLNHRFKRRFGEKSAFFLLQRLADLNRLRAGVSDPQHQRLLYAGAC